MHTTAVCPELMMQEVTCLLLQHALSHHSPSKLTIPSSQPNLKNALSNKKGTNEEMHRGVHTSFGKRYTDEI